MSRTMFGARNLCRFLPKITNIRKEKLHSSIIRHNNGNPLGVTGMKSGRTMADDEIERLRSVATHKREIDNMTISFEKTGMGKNVVLLMPGAIGSAKTDFTPQLENINKDLFTLIGWDPPGYGQSRPPKRTWPLHFFERDADVAAKLMQGMNQPKFSLLGWSDGGITALLMAAKYPDLIRKLVVWGANSYVTNEETEMYDSISDVNQWSERMRKPFIDLYGEDLFQQLWTEWITAVKRYFTERNGNFCEDMLSEIKCPTLIIHGTKDAMVPQFHPDHLHDKIKGSRLVNFPGGKHNLHMKYYKEFNSMVENFLLEPMEESKL